MATYTAEAGTTFEYELDGDVQIQESGSIPLNDLLEFAQIAKGKPLKKGEIAGAGLRNGQNSN